MMPPRNGLPINPIRPQFVPMGWGLFCAFGFSVGVQKIFEFPYLSPGWQGGIGGMVLALVGFLGIEGGGSRANASSPSQATG